MTQEISQERRNENAVVSIFRAEVGVLIDDVTLEQADMAGAESITQVLLAMPAVERINRLAKEHRAAIREIAYKSGGGKGRMAVIRWDMGASDDGE